LLTNPFCLAIPHFHLFPLRWRIKKTFLKPQCRRLLESRQHMAICIKCYKYAGIA